MKTQRYIQRGETTASEHSRRIARNKPGTNIFNQIQTSTLYSFHNGIHEFKTLTFDNSDESKKYALSNC